MGVRVHSTEQEGPIPYRFYDVLTKTLPRYDYVSEGEGGVKRVATSHFVVSHGVSSKYTPKLLLPYLPSIAK